MTKIIISFDYDNDVYFDEEDLMYSGVKYFNETEDMTITKVVRFIRDFYKYTGLNGGGTEEEIFLKGAYAVPNEYVQEILDEFEDYIEDGSKTLESVVKENLYLDVVDYLEYNVSGKELDELINAIAKENDFSVGTVGYSQWADYLMHKNTSEGYVQSMWDGTDFYTISLIDEDKDFNETVSRVYAEDIETLIEYTLEHFNIKGRDEFKVVDNEVGRYIDMPKVREIRTVKYSYEDIE